MCSVKSSIWLPCMQQWAQSNSRVHFIWHVMHYLVTFPSWGLRRSHPSLENSNGTACYDTMHTLPLSSENVINFFFPPVCSSFYRTNEPRGYHNTGLTHRHINQNAFVMANYCGHWHFHHWHVDYPISDIIMHTSQAISRQLLFPWYDLTRAELSRDISHMQPFVRDEIDPQFIWPNIQGGGNNVMRSQKAAPRAHGDSRNYMLYVRHKIYCTSTHLERPFLWCWIHLLSEWPHTKS